MKVAILGIAGTLCLFAMSSVAVAQTKQQNSRYERQLIEERRIQRRIEQPTRYTPRHYYGQGSRSRPADPGPGSTATPNR